MPRKPVPDTTKQLIKNARKGGESVASLAARFELSERTIQRITRGIDPKLQGPAVEVVRRAVAHGSTVIVDGIDLSEHIRDDITALSTSMSRVDPKSLEGVASTKLRYMQFYAELNPPTLEDFVDRLIDRPDFDPEKFVRILMERYAKKAG